MSPEQCAGGVAAIDERTDVYALGVVLYQLLADRLPYAVDGRRIGEAVRIIETVTPASVGEINPDVPAAISDICSRCLAKNPAERFSDAAAVADAITQAVAEMRPAPQSRPDEGPRLGRRAMLGAAVAAVALPVVAVVARRWSGSERFDREIDLLPRIDVKRDTVSGRWRLTTAPDGRPVVAGDEATPAKLKLPVDVPDEYDLFVEFSRRSGRQGIAVLCWARGHGFGFDVGAVNNTMVSFQDVDGLHIGQNETTVRRSGWIVPGQRHTALVQVRRDHVAGFVDGELIARLETNFTNLSYAPTWDIPGGGLGVGSWASPSTFSRILLRPPADVSTA